MCTFTCRGIGRGRSGGECVRHVASEICCVVRWVALRDLYECGVKSNVCVECETENPVEIKHRGGCAFPLKKAHAHIT